MMNNKGEKSDSSSDDVDQTCKVCPRCYTILSKDAIFCLNCGQKLSSDNVSPCSDSRVCPECGGENTLDAVFCRHCGKRLQNFEDQALLGEKGKVSRYDEHSDPPIDDNVKLERLLPHHLHCVSCGSVLDENMLLCSKCSAIIPFFSEYKLEQSLFEAKGERQARYVLQKYKTLRTIGNTLSHRLGKPWLEAQFIGSAIQVSQNQYSHIQDLALLAARILGLKHLPSIYVSGKAGWSINTFGTEDESFIVIGTFLLKQSTPGELLFLLGRELGHILCDHIFYRTISLVLSGQDHTPIVSHGLSSLLNIKKLMTLPFQIPLVTWLRTSEITADQAGLLVVQDIATAERALLLQSVKSRDILNNLDVDSYVRQQEELHKSVSKLSEFFTQTTPFITQRIKNLRSFYRSPEYEELVRTIQKHIPDGDQLKIRRALQSKPGAVLSIKKRSAVIGKCPGCKSTFSVPRKVLLSKKVLTLKCKKCGRIFKLEARSQKACKE